MDVIHALKRTEYIPYDANRIVVHAINPVSYTHLDVYKRQRLLLQIVKRFKLNLK